MNKTLCFGELLLRLSPANNINWLLENQLPAFVGGAEANVATALATWQMPAAYCTALPDNFLSRQLAQYLQQKNIDISAIHYSGNRIGIYYLQQGADMKNNAVVLDRANSSFATLQRGMIDWDTVLDGISWFHFSAIAPALSASAADVCLEALEVASKKNIRISVDLNYRNKLWQFGKEPIEIMPALTQYCDVVMGNIWAANLMLGTSLDEILLHEGTKESYLQHALNSSLAIKQQFPKVEFVANTFRFDKNEGIAYYTALHVDKLYASAAYDAVKVLDKVGSGDCYMAGLIYGLLNNHSSQQTVDFATAAAFNKLFIKGDTTNMSVEAIKATIQHG